MDDACLVSHSPSPQVCARDGDVWDDALAATSKHMGGRCLEPAEAEAMLSEARDVLEMVQVNLTHDTYNSECLLQAAAPAPPLLSACMGLRGKSCRARAQALAYAAKGACSSSAFGRRIQLPGVR